MHLEIAASDVLGTPQETYFNKQVRLKQNINYQQFPDLLTIQTKSVCHKWNAVSVFL